MSGFCKNEKDICDVEANEIESIYRLKIILGMAQIRKPNISAITIIMEMVEQTIMERK